MELEQAIRTRRTHKAFAPEPVDPQMLERLFELARWAPNHHLTNPWRFRVLGPSTLARLKQIAETLTPGSAGKLDRAPTLVVASVTKQGDVAQQQEDIGGQIIAAEQFLLNQLILLGRQGAWQPLRSTRDVLTTDQMGKVGDLRAPGNLFQQAAHKQQACDVDRGR